MRSKSTSSSFKHKGNGVQYEFRSSIFDHVESCSAKRLGGNLSKVNTELERTTSYTYFWNSGRKGYFLKLLGVIVSQDLTWNSHVDYILKKANSRLYALRQLKNAGLARDDLFQIYCSLIQPCIEYASPVWSDLTQNLINIIESVQKRALRIIFPSTSYEVALTESGLETLENRLGNACQMFADKMKSADHINNPLSTIFHHNTYKNSEHNYNLRNVDKHRIGTRTERFSNFITCKYI